jgi:hypothetical protein
VIFTVREETTAEAVEEEEEKKPIQRTIKVKKRKAGAGISKNMYQCIN